MIGVFLFHLIILYVVIVLVTKYLEFRKSDYKHESGNSFFQTLFNKGNYGEYLTFRYLEKLDNFKRFVVNVYIPKEDGTTTEIDLIMLSPTGIYVFESKNYSGWIFGDEKSQYWTQTLENKKKNKFFNPIWQNKGHINALKTFLRISNDEIFKSYIVFSERCVLKKVELESSSVKVIKRNQLINTIKEDIRKSKTELNVEEIINIHARLKEFSNVDEEFKRKHIENLKRPI